MKDLTDEFKLSVRSVAEVFAALGTMVHQLKANRRVRFRGKKPTRAAVVNAALLYLESLPPEQWERALDQGLRRLEGILEADEPAPAPASTSTTTSAPSKRVSLKVEDVSPAPAPAKPAARRKKGG